MCSLFAHTIVSNVAKDVIIPQFAKGELAPVAVREKVLQGMKTGAHETVGLPKVCPLAPSGTSAHVFLEYSETSVSANAAASGMILGITASAISNIGFPGDWSERKRGMSVRKTQSRSE